MDALHDSYHSPAGRPDESLPEIPRIAARRQHLQPILFCSVFVSYFSFFNSTYVEGFFV
jgi:hypothetical protein